jgi:hypothetical protein
MNWLRTGYNDGEEFGRFQLLTAVRMKMAAFWDTAPCSLVEVDRRFGHTYSHQQ